MISIQLWHMFFFLTFSIGHDLKWKLTKLIIFQRVQPPVLVETCWNPPNHENYPAVMIQGSLDHPRMIFSRGILSDSHLTMTSWVDPSGILVEISTDLINLPYGPFKINGFLYHPWLTKIIQQHPETCFPISPWKILMLFFPPCHGIPIEIWEDF